MAKQQTVDATEPNCFNKQKCKPVIYNGMFFSDYWVDKNGNLWSTKGLEPRKIRYRPNSDNYPIANIMYDDGKRKTVSAHKLVCEAYHKFPKPKSVNKKEWDITPDSVKKLVKKMYQVNHIDHDHLNFHPSNLEWVTVGENAEKYQEHRLKKIVRVK